jgi:hypothetical protein
VQERRSGQPILRLKASFLPLLLQQFGALHLYLMTPEQRKKSLSAISNARPIVNRTRFFVA